MSNIQLLEEDSKMTLDIFTNFLGEGDFNCKTACFLTELDKMFKNYSNFLTEPAFYKDSDL
jgi:hypothetical protein